MGTKTKGVFDTMILQRSTWIVMLMATANVDLYKTKNNTKLYTIFMTGFNNEFSEEEFKKGKEYVDSGKYKDSIDIYDKLIANNAMFEGDVNVNILLINSLNNRGMAKCQLAEKRPRNKELLLRGMDDFERAIAIDNPANEDDKRSLTAYSNLERAKQRLIDFEKV